MAEIRKALTKELEAAFGAAKSHIMNTTTLPPRTKFYGWDYNTNRQLRMTGKEWHQYAKRDEFKTERGSDAAWGNGCEVWLDGTDQNHK